MILTNEQQRAYNRYIKARDKMFKREHKWIPASDYLACVDVVGMNHPLFLVNHDYQEYKEAFLAWLAVEPEFREKERLRASRGDYGVADSWEEKPSRVKELK